MGYIILLHRNNVVKEILFKCFKVSKRCDQRIRIAFPYNVGNGYYYMIQTCALIQLLNFVQFMVLLVINVVRVSKFQLISYVLHIFLLMIKN